MGLRTADEFLVGLRDAREVYYRGERVEQVPDHPELGVVARHVAIDFQLAEDPRFCDLARHKENGEEYSAYYHIPRDTSDLAARSRLIETATTEGATLVILIKEIGTDALFALMRILAKGGTGEGRARLEAFYQRCRREDLALGVAQTDVKRGSQQAPFRAGGP